MQASAKHWIDPALCAANVREVEVPPAMLTSLAPLVSQVQAIAPGAREAVIGDGLALAIARPKGWASDIAWLSQADTRAFAFFDRLFGDLRLAEQFAPHIAHDRAPVLYSGFFVTRSRCDAPSFHHDWADGNNDGFTLIAPLSGNCADIGLVYADVRGQERSYTYRQGKGVVFGDHFYHATAPGRSDQPTVLLSLTFGTDRMDSWHRLSATAGQQGMLHRRPDGVFVQDGKEL